MDDLDDVTESRESPEVTTLPGTDDAYPQGMLANPIRTRI